MDALMRDLLPVIEFAAKAARTALAHVGAAIDCGMPAASAQRAHAAAGAFGPIDSAVPFPAETVPAGVSAGVQTTAPPAGLSWVPSPGPHVHPLVTGNTPTPVRSANPVQSGAGVGLPDGLSWADWAVPAICDVLAVHFLYDDDDAAMYECLDENGDSHARFGDPQAWREHVAPLIAERLETAALALDPAKSARESDQRIAFTLGLFEQHRKPQ